MCHKQCDAPSTSAKSVNNFYGKTTLTHFVDNMKQKNFHK